MKYKATILGNTSVITDRIEEPEGEPTLARPEGSATDVRPRIRAAMSLSLECLKTYLEKGYERQSGFAAGQLDAFKAVLRWMDE